VLWRDIFVTGRELPIFLAQVVLQPLFLLLIFGKILTELGYARNGYAQLLFPGVVALTIVLTALQSTALPLVIDFSFTKEIEDRLLAPMPVGWLTASAQITSDTGDRIDLVLTSPLPGLIGARAGTGCLYQDLVMLHADPSRILVRIAGATRVWVIPFEGIASVAASTGVPYPASEPC
jgi:hypothetical protein